MNQQNTDLVERVARSLCEERTWIGVWESNYISEVEKDAWKRDARAAIRIVLEEAAKTAERGLLRSDISLDPATVYTIAENIRAMIPKDGE